MSRLKPVVLAVASVLAACTNPAPSVSPSPLSSAGLSAAASSTVPATSAISEATPAITGLSGRIVFTRAGGQYGDETVFIASMDGTNEHKLSEFDKSCCPWATVDGSRILIGAASPDGRITVQVSKPDGSDASILPLPVGTLNLGGGPFSPDGQWIMLEGFDDAHPEVSGIYMARAADGSDLRRVTKRHFIPGDFSPDGTKLLVFGNAAGNPPPPGSLWIANFDGSGLRQLTPTATQVQCCFNYRWSPDGSKILFASPDGSLWTIAPGGSSLTEVFQDAGGRYAVTPTWSPDGSMILFALDPTANPFAHPTNGLYVIRADGSGLTLVIGGTDFKREPVWLK